MFTPSIWEQICEFEASLVWSEILSQNKTYQKH